MEALFTYTKTSIAGWPISASGSVGHYRLHGAVGVLERLRSVGMRDELGRRRAVGVLDGLSGGGASLCSLCRNLPLRNAGGELDVVVLFAGTVPLRDPAGGQLRRGKRGTLAARRRWAGHGLVVSRRGSGRRRGGLRGTKAMAGGGRKASNGGTAGFF